MKPSVHLPLYSRIAIAIAAGVIVAALLGQFFGAKTESSFSGAIGVSEGNAALIAVLSVSSSGEVEISVEGARSVYYLEIAGSPLTAINQVTALGVQIESQRFFYDVRSGLGYGDALLKADPALLAVLPRLSGNVMEAGKAGENSFLVREEVEAGQGLAVIAIPGSDRIEYSGVFRVEGYYRMNLETALLIASAITLASLVPTLAGRALQKLSQS